VLRDRLLHSIGARLRSFAIVPAKAFTINAKPSSAVMPNASGKAFTLNAEQCRAMLA